MSNFRVLAASTPDFAGQAGNKVRQVYASGPRRVVKIDEPLRKTERYVLLQIESDDKATFWLHPKIQRGRQEQSLTVLRPVSIEVNQSKKQDHFGVVVPKWALPPLDMEDEKFCDEFLYAHSRSLATYDIPDGAVSFSTIGYCLYSGSVRFELHIDNRPKPIAASELPIAKLDVRLPEGARKLSLVIDPKGSTDRDVSFWLYPRFHLHEKAVRRGNKDK